ncbi:hypothetical protein KAR91_67035 [Candidatus Pacearchaeota archaeon]|nr:hypothetical protein [Candidatus Pacearchaeota archaeon]
METIEAMVKPEMLIWAREFAQKNILHDWGASENWINRILSPLTIDKIEAGAPITVDGLRKLANAYEIPLNIFYLPRPPGDTIKVLRVDRLDAPDISSGFIYDIDELENVLGMLIGDDREWEDFQTDETIITINVVDMDFLEFTRLPPLDEVL